jgi:hypothetical protein
MLQPSEKGRWSRTPNPKWYECFAAEHFSDFSVFIHIFVIAKKMMMMMMLSSMMMILYSI